MAAKKRWAHVLNRPMREALEKGTCIDVGNMHCNVAAENGDLTKDCWLISSVYKGKDAEVDYCATVPAKPGAELWIWSIGIDDKTGRVWASKDNRFYQAEDKGFTCVFLR